MNARVIAVHIRVFRYGSMDEPASASPTTKYNGNELKTGDRVLLQHATSDLGALLHILKGSLGAGILAAPYAFKNSGLAFGVIGSVIVGIIITHTTAMLVDCSQRLCDIYHKSCLSFSDTAEYAFRYGYGGRLDSYAPKARLFVNFFLFITYYGGSAYYILLIASMIKQVSDEYWHLDVNVRYFTTALLFLLYPIGIVRLIKFLVPFSAIANALLMTALLLLFVDISLELPPLDSRVSVASVEQWPIFIAMIFASMEGIGPIMPVENEMKNPKHLTHGPRLLYIAMLIVGVLTTLVGFFGYWKYGDDVKGAISLNLPDDWISITIKVTIALVILFSFGLQMTVSTKVIWDSLPRRLKEKTWYYYALRSCLICGSVLMATALPSLGGVVGLVGSIGFSTLGIFVPAVIEMVLYGGQESSCVINWTWMKDVFLIVFALVCGTAGTYCSIQELLKS